MKITIQCSSGALECDHLFDMVWIDASGTAQEDCSYLYGRCSSVLAAAIRHSKRDEHGVFRVLKTGYLANDLTFSFLKNLCHRNEISLNRSDKMTDLLQIYKMLQCYDISGSGVCKIVLEALITKLDPGNTVQILNELHEAPFCAELQAAAERLFLLFPLECLHKARNIEDHVLALCCNDALNSTEEALMTVLREKNQTAALRSVVRSSGLTFDYLMQFRSENQDLYPDEWYMTVLQEIHNGKVGSARVKRNLYGHFPHYLKLASEIEITLSACRYTVVFLTVSVQKHSTVALPAFNSCAGVIQLQAEMSSSHLGLRGSINRGLHGAGAESSDSTQRTKVEIECRLLNYMKNINKTHTAEADTTFVLERMLTLNTLSNEGYCFNRKAYPALEAGTDLLIRLSISTMQSEI